MPEATSQKALKNTPKNTPGNGHQGNLKNQQETSKSAKNLTPMDSSQIWKYLDSI